MRINTHSVHQVPYTVLNALCINSFNPCGCPTKWVGPAMAPISKHAHENRQRQSLGCEPRTLGSNGHTLTLTTVHCFPLCEDGQASADKIAYKGNQQIFLNK